MKKDNVKLYMITSGILQQGRSWLIEQGGGGVLEMSTWGVHPSSIKENYVKTGNGNRNFSINTCDPVP